MSELQQLAELKINAECMKLCESLPEQIQSLKRANAAKGLLHSGNTVHGVVEICSNALDELGSRVLEEYHWAISQALLVNQSWIEDMIQSIPAQLQPLRDRCLAHITEEATLAGAPNAISQCHAEFENQLTKINNDIMLSLRSSFSERKRGLVRAIGSAIPSWLSKLFGK
jgi:prephenate dehydratase